MDHDPAEQCIEEEIDKAFDEIELDGMETGEFLGKLELQPLRSAVMENYGSGKRGRPVQYPPLALAKILILQDLLGIDARAAALRRIRRNADEAEALGFTHTSNVPSQQAFYSFLRDRVDALTKELIEFTVEYIREKCREQDKLLDVELIDEEGAANGKSEATRYRKEQEKLDQVSNLLKWKVFPKISFNRVGDNTKYDTVEFLDLLTFVAMEHTFTNNGWDIMRSIVDKDVPRSQTLLKYIRELKREKIKEMYDETIDKCLELARNEGFFNRPVPVMLDFTKFPYYGDKNDEKVREGREEAGTTHFYEFVVAKAKHKGMNFVVGVKPVGPLDDKADTTEELMEEVKERVDVRYVVSDREFSDSPYLDMFEEHGLTYYNLAKKNARVKRIIANNDPPAVVPYRFGREDADTWIVLEENSEGKTIPFITNASNSLRPFMTDMLETYADRWDIETGFRDLKEKFLPRTTSKDFNVRLFYFLFSTVVYNLWTFSNAVVMLYLDGEVRDEKIVTAKKFRKVFFEAKVDYG